MSRQWTSSGTQHTSLALQQLSRKALACELCWVLSGCVVNGGANLHLYLCMLYIPDRSRAVPSTVYVLICS